jgi:hypothetical protein
MAAARLQRCPTRCATPADVRFAGGCGSRAATHQFIATAAAAIESTGIASVKSTFSGAASAVASRSIMGCIESDRAAPIMVGTVWSAFLLALLPRSPARLSSNQGRISERRQFSISSDRFVEHDGKQIAGVFGGWAAGASSGRFGGSTGGE